MIKRAVIGICFLALAGCGGDSAKEITETRVTQATGTATAAMEPPPAGAGGAGAPEEAPRETVYRWELPPGWTETAPTAMRLGNFAVAGQAEIECSITTLHGAAGGAEANINRWRGQMGQPALSTEALEALPKVEMLGEQRPFVAIEGVYTSMSGEAHEGYMMLAVVCARPDSTVFVKMTGPAAAVLAEKENFTAFCAGIREEETPDDAGNQETQ